MIKFSVIIVSYINLEIIIDCLNSIQKYNDIGNELEVIVVDNSPTDKIVHYLHEHFPWVKAIKNENKGFGQGNNVGVLNSSGEYVLFLNPDTILVEPIFQFAIDKFESKKKLGAFGVKLVDKDLNRNMSYYQMDKSSFIAGQVDKISNKLDIFQDGKMFIAGADIFIRRDLFIKAGMFDEKIFMYNEEADLFKRVKALNYKTAYFKNKQIIHLEGKTSTTSEAPLRRRMDSSKYYCQKYNLNFDNKVNNEIRYNYIKLFIYKLLGKNESSSMCKNNIKVLKEYSTSNFLLNYLLKMITILMGIFVTMPIVTIKAMGRHISFFNIFFMLFYFFMIFLTFYYRKQLKFRFGTRTKLYIAWFMVAIVSTLFGLWYFRGMPDWSNASFDYLPKIILYLTLLIMISIHPFKNDVIHPLLKGFLIGCILNLSWAVIEGVVFYTFGGIPLNDRLFGDFAKTITSRPYITIISKQYGIRTPGFNWDPAHLGGIIPIVVLYAILQKKYLYLLLCAGALALSQSTTGLATSLVVVLVNIRKINIKLHLKEIIMLVFGLLLIGTILFFTDLKIVESLKENAISFYERVNKTYIKNFARDPHVYYYLYLPIAIAYSGFKVLTGTGFGTASYPYFSPEISNLTGKFKAWPFDPESTYVSYLFDVGIFGLILYLVIIAWTYLYFNKHYKNKKNSLILASLAGIIISGLFYHYILTAYQVLILICSVVLMDQNKMNEREKQS